MFILISFQLLDLVVTKLLTSGQITSFLAVFLEWTHSKSFWSYHPAYLRVVHPSLP
jgi:hypothetical protein